MFFLSMSHSLRGVGVTECWILTYRFSHFSTLSCSNKLIEAEPSPFFICSVHRALARMKLLPVTHVLVDMWMLTVKPVHKL